MPRQVRIVIPDEAHHITQRGNYQQEIFEETNDFRQYLLYLKECSEKYHIDILAYCLMNNHIHIIGIPHDKKSLGMAFNTLTMRYAQYVNTKKKNHLAMYGKDVIFRV